MKRRMFITSLSLATVTGCTQSGTNQAQTPTETPTATQTKTASSTPRQAPEIEIVSLLTHWDEFGNVETNQVDSVGKGGNAVLGFRYFLPVHDGKSEEFVQVTIYKKNGPSVEKRTDTAKNLSSTADEEWERWMGFDTTTWETGAYEAEIIIRDEVTSKNSETNWIDFEVVEPLGKSEAEFIEVRAPDTVIPGETFTFELVVDNTSSRDSSIISRLSARADNSDWFSVGDEKFRMNIAADENNSWTSGEISFDQEGTYSYRWDSIGETVTFECSR